MAANALRLLCFTAVVAGAVASFSPHSGESQGRHPVTATVAGSVKEPPAVKRAKFAAKPVAKRPVKARPRAQAPAAPNDPLWSSSWSLTKTHAVDAWKLTTGGPETVVAILDTGVDLGHPDLQGPSSRDTTLSTATATRATTRATARSSPESWRRGRTTGSGAWGPASAAR